VHWLHNKPELFRDKDFIDGNKIMIIHLLSNKTRCKLKIQTNKHKVILKLSPYKHIVNIVWLNMYFISREKPNIFLTLPNPATWWPEYKYRIIDIKKQIRNEKQSKTSQKTPICALIVFEHCKNVLFIVFWLVFQYKHRNIFKSIYIHWKSKMT